MSKLQSPSDMILWEAFQDHRKLRMQERLLRKADKFILSVFFVFSYFGVMTI